MRERDPLAHYQLGLAFRQKRYYVEALREYRMALEAGEDRHLVLQAMAEVHLLRRDHGAALELYDELLREHPAVPKLWNERGVCLHQAGRRDEAAAAYERAIAADRTYALAWNNLGVLRRGRRRVRRRDWPRSARRWSGSRRSTPRGSTSRSC